MKRVLSFHVLTVIGLSLDVKNAEFWRIPISVNVDLRGRDKMGYNVVAIAKVMPVSPEIDREKLKKDIESKIPQNMKLHKIEEEPIAFGIVALNAFVLLSDAEGGVDDIEERIKEIEDVSEVDIIDVRRLL